MRAISDKDRHEIDREVDAILECVEDLRDLLGRYRVRLDKLAEEREETRKEQWRFKKEIATLSRATKEYDELLTENERLRTHREELRAGLKRIVGHTRALLSEHRP